MLEPDSRVVLLNQLRPPAGFRVEAAVVTTFTLSLTTALVPPLAFASSDISATADPVAVLSSVRECADIVDIFCQPGQIEVPEQASDLMACLEPMVHPVQPNPGFLFHPKLWFLRYVNDAGEQRYRLLCTSRNLVDSTAWDLAVTLDGIPTSSPRDENRDLAALLRWLPDHVVTPLDPTRRRRIRRLAAAAETIEWQLPPDVEELCFHLWGTDSTPRADFGGTRHLVVAPFMDARGLRHLTPGSRDITIVSRPEALDTIPDGELGRATSKGDRVYVLDSAASLFEHDLEDDAEAPGRTVPVDRDGLHAKLVIAQRFPRAHTFIGSPNATAAAFGGNVEFAVELVGTVRRTGISQVIGPEAPLRDYLEPYAGKTEVDDTEDPLRQLKNVLRRLASIALEIAVTSRGDTFELLLRNKRRSEVLGIPSRMTASVSLLTRPGVAVSIDPNRPLEVRFTEVPLCDITPFVVVELTEDSETLSSVVHAPLLNDPPDRLDEVLARQIDTPEKFIHFVMLLLGFADGSGEWFALLDGADDGAYFGSGSEGWSGLLEELVLALANKPATIDKVNELVTSLKSTEEGAKVLPRRFEELWANVAEARRRLARETR
ncbi:phospholipase D family protein [Enemella sp. A6]|uniref:phospholipase D family protein n=1 Tax=Enemella sp. A6 TaxID=3440152 RepID=UPI003EC053D4